MCLEGRIEYACYRRTLLERRMALRGIPEDRSKTPWDDQPGIPTPHGADPRNEVRKKQVHFKLSDLKFTTQNDLHQ